MIPHIRSEKRPGRARSYATAPWPGRGRSRRRRPLTGHVFGTESARGPRTDHGRRRHDRLAHRRPGGRAGGARDRRARRLRARPPREPGVGHGQRQRRDRRGRHPRREARARADARHRRRLPPGRHPHHAVRGGAAPGARGPGRRHLQRRRGRCAGARAQARRRLVGLDLRPRRGVPHARGPPPLRQRHPLRRGQGLQRGPAAQLQSDVGPRLPRAALLQRLRRAHGRPRPLHRGARALDGAHRSRGAAAHLRRRPADHGLRLRRRHRARQHPGRQLRPDRRGLQRRDRRGDQPARAGRGVAAGHGLRPLGGPRPAARGQRRHPTPGRHERRARAPGLRRRGRAARRPHAPGHLVARRARARRLPAREGLVMEVPFARPSLTEADGAAVAEAVASGWVSQGPRVAAFEAAYAERVGAPDAVATTNCTTALHLALYVSGVGPGDEVIVPSLSFIATANAVWQCGATPVFADIDPVTYNLDPEAAERAITPATKAIMPVHQVGLPADMDRFIDLADRYGVRLVEDAACAIGAEHRGRQIGSLGPLTCFSLHPRKVITTGEGGMITLQDPEVAARLRQLRQHAMDVSDLARHGARDVVIESYPERGWNYRMTDMQAALGLCQLDALDEILADRRRVAERYTEAIADIDFLAAPFEPGYAERTWQSYAVTLAPGAPLDRNELMRLLLADGVPTRRGVMAIHEEGAYAGAQADLPHTEAASRSSLMLPLFAGMTDEKQEHVIGCLARHVAAVPA